MKQSIRSLAVLVALLTPAGICHALELAADAIVAVAGTSASCCNALRTSAGEAIVGPATSASYQSHGGFPLFPISGGSSSVEVIADLVPRTTQLYQSYPNPAPNGAHLRFQIAGQAGATPARLEVFDVSGRVVSVLIDQPLEDGAYETRWDGRTAGGAQAASGIYFARFTAGNYAKTIRMVISD